MEVEKTSKKNIANCGNVVISGNTIEYTRFKLGKNNINWRKLKNNIYVNLDTGEYIEKKKSDLKKFKTSNFTSVKHSIKNARRVINCNFFGDLNERFITLTYADNMQDVNKLYNDFNKFIKRLKYFLGDKNLLYINIVEPQGRGAWHCHLLVKSDKIYKLTDLDVYYLWGKGITYNTSLDNIDNVGAYLSSYLSNTKEKKGARLFLYPQNMRIMRCSRNCKKPEIIKGVYTKDFKEKFKGLKLRFADNYYLKHNGEIVNSISYKSYVRC